MQTNRNAELAKNTIILSVGQIIPKIVSIVSLPLLTTYLSKLDYGYLDLTLTVASFAVPLISLQIQQAVFRYLIEAVDNEKNRIATSSFLFVALALAITSIPIIFFWNEYCGNLQTAILFMLYYAAELALNWAGQLVRGLGDNVGYSIAYMIYSIVYFAGLIVLVFINHELFLDQIIIIMILSYMSGFVFLAIKDRIFGYIAFGFFSRKTLNMLLRYSAPMIISTVSLWVVNLSDRFMVSAYLGIEVTALYAVTNKIPNMVSSAYNIFNLAWTENASRLSEEEKNEGYYTDFFDFFYCCMIGMVSLLIAVSPLLYNVLVDEKYAEGYYLVPILFLGTLLSSLVSFFGSIYVGEKMTNKVGISSAIGAVINVGINLIFMSHFGVVVGAVSTVVSFFCICVYRAIDIRRYVRISYKPHKIIVGILSLSLVTYFSIKFQDSILLSICFTGVISVIYNFIYNRKFIARIAAILRNKLFSKNKKDI